MACLSSCATYRHHVRPEVRAALDELASAEVPTFRYPDLTALLESEDFDRGSDRAALCLLRTVFSLEQSVHWDKASEPACLAPCRAAVSYPPGHLRDRDMVERWAPRCFQVAERYLASRTGASVSRIEEALSMAETMARADPVDACRELRAAEAMLGQVAMLRPPDIPVFEHRIRVLHEERPAPCEVLDRFIADPEVAAAVRQLARVDTTWARRSQDLIRLVPAAGPRDESPPDALRELLNRKRILHRDELRARAPAPPRSP